MIIGFTLNDSSVTLDVEPHKRLVDILREDMGLIKTKAGCYGGYCGSCLVLFNDRVVPSCLIPAFNLRGDSIITIEGFEKTREYKDIVEGFSRVGYEPCKFCKTGKIFSIHSLLMEEHDPSENLIMERVSGNQCWCSDNERLIAAIKRSALLRARRKRERKK